MPFQLSPGVQVIEKDFTSIIPAVSASTGGVCGPFTWGPVLEPIRISSENELVSLFGKPNSANYASWFTAANFLSYSNNMLVNRLDTDSLNAVSTTSGGISASNIQITNKGTGYTTGTTIVLTFSAPTLGGGITASGTATWTGDTAGVGTWAVNITTAGSGYIYSGGVPAVTISVPSNAPNTPIALSVVSLNVGGVKIKNLDHYQTGFSNDTATYGLLAAKFPGSKGNGLRVFYIDYGNWSTLPTSITTKFSKRPGTSSYAALKGIIHDELHIAVYDNAEGSFSGTPNALLETFEFMSKLSDAKREDGTSNFYKNIVNSNSKYLWVLRHPGSNVFSEFLTSNGFAGLGGDGSYLVFEETSGITFTSSNKTIAITDVATYGASLSSFKQFFDGAPDKEQRQIVISGTLSNNVSLTVTSISPVLDGSNAVIGYNIVVAESIVNETVNASLTPVSIRSVIKSSWGSTSDAVIAATGDGYLPVLRASLISTLAGGTDDFTVTDADYQNAYALFANLDEYDVSLLPLPNVSATTAGWVVSNVAEVRKDCVVFISPNTAGNPIMAGATAVTDIRAFKDSTQINSSYAFMDSGFKYMYDRYNDVYRWVPLSGDVAGLCARTDLTSDPWFSPGGFNRGVVKNIIKLAFNPNQTQRDELYVNGINPVVTFKGQGTILYGDKTMLGKPSAFDRINVRRLFIVLEKAIATASRFQLFEFNDTFTRAQFKNLVEPFLRDVQGRRGVTDFRVVCDESNNTGEVIDRNEFVADIYIKPNRSINFITLNFIAARSSVTFEELGA